MAACCLLLYSQSAYSQTLTPNLIDDSATWSGPSSQGDCTYRPSGHGTWGSNPIHTQGDWYSNPAYRGCPQISQDGTMRFSWRPEDNMKLTNTIDATIQAFADTGIEVNGYTYSWKIKNADAEYIQNSNAVGPYDKDGYGYSQDLLEINVQFFDKEGIVWDKSYDYNYRISNWTEFSGSEEFTLTGSDIDKIVISVDGYDAGYWSGYYGPEVKDVQFQLIFSAAPIDKCGVDPLSSPTCIGYIDAFNKSVGIPTQEQQLAAIEKQYIKTESPTDYSVIESFTTPESEVVTQVEETISQAETPPVTTNVDALSVARDAESSAASVSESAQNIAQQSARASASLDDSFSGNQAALSSTQAIISSNNLVNGLSGSRSYDGSIVFESGVNDLLSFNSHIGVDNTDIGFGDLLAEDGLYSIEIEVASFDTAVIDTAITNALAAIIESGRGSSEEESDSGLSPEGEDILVAAAKSGDTSEDAQSALLGYNPNFRKYNQPQMSDGQMYESKDIYTTHQNHDNPNARFFNGASDVKHGEMVRQQYD